MKSQNTKSTDSLKREVDSQLARVEADMNEIQDRLSPGQLIDDAIFPKERTMASTIDHLKANPVGTAFLSLGTILLMEDNEHHTIEYNARVKATSLKQNFLDARETFKEDISDRVDQFRTRVNDVKSKVTTKFDDIENRFGMNEPTASQGPNFTFTEEDTKQSLKERAKEYLESAKEKASDYKTFGKERIQNLDPLTYMALGAGLGALTGSALPISEKEETLLKGKVDDKLKDLSTDLQAAINECSNILKDLVINDVKNYNVRLFK